MKNNLSLLKHCLVCKAKCCKYGSPFLLESEKNRILDKTKKYVFEKINGYYIIPQEPCPFLKGNRCSIEEIKPIGCRAWPMGFKIKNNKIIFVIDESCPAVSHLTYDFINSAKKELLNYPVESRKNVWKSIKRWFKVREL